MGQIAMSILPPEYWQDFELLTWDVCRILWQDDYARLNGRSGQEQAGVDVYGRDYKADERWIGVQCKKRMQMDATGRILAGGVLTEKIIRGEVNNAKTFEPELHRFIIATTALRDSGAQKIIREVDDEQRAINSFGVSAWFWEDYQEQLNQHSELMYRYYEDVLKSRQSYEPDKHILYLLHTAFSRPAFDTPLDLEYRSEDFLQAISATQEAIKTGRLKDRQNNIIETAQRANKLSKPEWREKIADIGNALQVMRNFYTKAMKQGKIYQMDYYCIGFTDHQIKEEIDNMRREVLKLLNQVLEEAGVDSVRSMLLQS